MASSGPVRRNFGRTNAPSRPSPHRKKGRALRTFFITLFAIVAALSMLAIYLSRQIMRQHESPSPHSEMDNASQKAVLSSGAANVPAPSNNAISAVSDRDRVYCMIPFIWNEEIYKAIMDTWGKRCDVINFFTDAQVGGKLQGDKIAEDPMGYKNYTEFPPGTFPENVVFINMTRTWHDCPLEKGVKKVCRHIWEKMWRCESIFCTIVIVISNSRIPPCSPIPSTMPKAWVYVEENHLGQAEWFCKVDYDTFFFPDNVKYFVRHKKWNPFDEYHYFGHMIQHRKQGREPMIAGATACWSRKTLDDIADVYRQMPKGSSKGERGRCEDRAQATEEASTSLCLKKYLNVSAYPARDDELRECITVAKYKDQLTWNRTEQGEWWYWKGKPKDAGQMENSIAIRPIGLHKHKNEWEIRELEQQFFGASDNKFLKGLNDRTKRYVRKVRKAMGTD